MIPPHHRRVVAGREALLLALEEELPVRRRLAGLDAEVLLDGRDDLVGATEHAADIGADRDMNAAGGLRLEHRVEARDLVDLDRRQPDVRGDRVHELGREPAVVLVLRGPERGDDRGPAPVRRELREPGVDLVARRGARAAARGGGEWGEPVVDLVARVLAERARAPRIPAHRSISPNTMS